MPGTAVKVPRAQQQWQHQLVADHGGHGNRLDNHHAGGRRQAADEGKQRQQRLAGGHRQRQHEGLGVHRAAAKIQQSAQRNRQHEQVDQQQVERKHPDRPAQVALTDVFHHHHLKLPGQKQHRQHRQQDQRKPLRPGKAIALLQPHQALQGWHRLGAGKQVAQAVEQAINHKHTHCQEGHQLDHRLEGYRRHHALVPLGGVQVPGAKHHGETGQHQRDIKSTVAQPVHRTRRGRARRCGEQAITR